MAQILATINSDFPIAVFHAGSGNIASLGWAWTVDGPSEDSRANFVMKKFTHASRAQLDFGYTEQHHAACSM